MSFSALNPTRAGTFDSRAFVCRMYTSGFGCLFGSSKAWVFGVQEWFRVGALRFKIV